MLNWLIQNSRYVNSDFSQYGKFLIELPYRGQGITVGNSLKRVLLSNLEGAAITKVKIAGVNCRLDSIPGVREDVLSLLLNLKELAIKSYSSKSYSGKLLAQGAATVTAAELDLPSEFEIINPRHRIATLSEEATLELEFLIELGKGYRLLDTSSGETSTSGFLEIDAVFMPVRKVEYSIEESHSRYNSWQEQLTIEIWTNGVLCPEYALRKAASILVSIFSQIQFIDFSYAHSQSPSRPPLPNRLHCLAKTTTLELEEFDFMSEEVKAQIGRMDDRIAQILVWTEKQFTEVSKDENLLKLEDLEQENLELQIELSKTQEEVKQANSRNEALSEYYKQLEQKDRDRDDILLKLSKQIEKLTRQQREQQSSLDAAQQNLRDVLREKAELTKQVSNLQQENIKSYNLLEQARIQANQKKDELSAQLNSSRQENSQTAAQLSEAQSQIALLTQARSHLESQLQQAQEQLSRAEEQQSQHRQLQEDWKQFQESRLEVEKQLTERSQLLDEANHQLNVLTQRLSPAIESLIEQLSQRHSSETNPEAQALFLHLSNDLTEAQEQLRQIRPVALPLVEELRQENAQLQSNLSTAQTEAQEIRQERSQLTSDLDKAIRQLRQVEHEKELSSQERSTLERQLTEVNLRSQDLQRQIQQTQQQLSNAQAERTQLQSRLTQTEGQLQQTQQQLQQTQFDLNLTQQEQEFALQTQQDKEATINNLLERFAQKDSQFSAKDAEVRQVRQQLEAEQTDRSQCQNLVIELQNQLQQTQQQLTQVQQQLQESESVRQTLLDQLSQADPGAQDWFRNIFKKK